MAGWLNSFVFYTLFIIQRNGRLTNHRFIYGNIIDEIDVETSFLIEANYEA